MLKGKIRREDITLNKIPLTFGVRMSFECLSSCRGLLLRTLASIYAHGAVCSGSVGCHQWTAGGRTDEPFDTLPKRASARAAAAAAAAKGCRAACLPAVAHDSQSVDRGCCCAHGRPRGLQIDTARGGE